MRALVLTTVVAGALAMLLMGRPAIPAQPADAPPQLTYVTTAHQLGVVGYRDPFGAISPDGTRIAYTEGRFIRVAPIGGGASITLAPGEGQIRYLTWIGNSIVAAEDVTATGRWWTYRIGEQGRRPLWGATANQLRQLTWRPDGLTAAAIRFTSNGAELVTITGDEAWVARPIDGRPSWPAFRPGDEIGCIIDARITLPCGSPPWTFDVDRAVYGPIAFAADGKTVYFSSPNDRGMVELWSADLTTRQARRLSGFARDAYAPSVAADGTVMFKVQTYRTTLADVAFEGGQTRQLTTFQSETPSYHPTRPLIAFTYGSWRRVIDDAKYPDIAQEIGVVDVSQSLPATQPSEVLEASDSEDQAMTWSPNGRWIAFHSHREMSDDVWLRPAARSADASAEAHSRRITFLGRGAEVGWPRWSPDGRTVLLNGARQSDGASVLYAIGVNQETGATTSALREIAVAGVTGEMGHAEWMPDSLTVIALAREGPGRHVIFTVPASGGRATVLHRYATEHDFPGIGVSTNGRFVAFAAPAADGFYQIFVKAVGGVTPAVQLTTDRSHKTQPAFSPDGGRVAFTVWSYDATFWAFNTR